MKLHIIRKTYIFKHEAIGKVQITQVYAPTSTTDEQQIEQFYDDITTAGKSEKTRSVFIMGYFNYKIRDQNIDNISTEVNSD